MSDARTPETLAFGRAAAASSVYRLAGQLSLGVVVKATFALEHGREATPREPEPVATKDRYFDRSPARSLEAASDLVPYKPRGEVWLRGHAYAPGGVPRATAAVRLALRGAEARVDKTLHIYGDRSGPTAPPAAFQRMPLVYERAAGGPGTDNPLGVPVDGPGQPNLVDPSDPTRTACFGPVSPYWPARKRLVPAGVRRALDQAVPELPADFDYEYFCSAPADQRTTFFRGDEWLVLDGMHPALARVQTRLPRARAAARVVWPLPARPPAEVALALDTLVVDADRLTVTAVWRGLVVGVRAEDVGAVRVVAGAVLGDEPFVWPEVAPLPAPAASPAPRAAPPPPRRAAIEDPLSQTSMLSRDDDAAAAHRTATPFARVPPPTPASAPAPESPDFGEVTGFFDPRAAAARPVTPFSPSPHRSTAPPSITPASSPPAAGSSPWAAIDDADTTLGDEPTAGDALPFATAPRAPLPFAPAPPRGPVPPAPPPASGPAASPWATGGRPEPESRVASSAPPAPSAAPPPLPGAMPAFAQALMGRPLPAPEPPPVVPVAAAVPPFVPAAAVPAFVPAAAVPAFVPAAAAAEVSGAPGPAAAAPSGGGADLGPLPAPPGGGKTPPGPPPRGDKPAIPVVSPTPDALVVVTVPWQVDPPRDSLTIVVKGTFDLVPDGPAVLRARGDFPLGDIHLDDDPERSLSYGSDLAVHKPRADVWLTGSACAPGTGRVTTAQVELRFGGGGRGSPGFVRRATVVGDRRWQKSVLGTTPTAPEPFTSLPLTWERAFGAPGYEANPWGTGYKAHPGADGVARLPNLEDPSRPVSAPSDTPEPVCFAPIGMLWKERWSKLGTYDKRWFKLRWPYFPEDFDWGFCQVAPRAQQLPYLRGDESYTLVGMRPEAPKLSGKLPGLRVRCFVLSTEAAGGAFREVPLVLDTAGFQVDELRLALVWRGRLEVSDDEAPELEAIFVVHEPLAATPMTLAEARAAYLAAATPKPPEETSPEAPEEEEEEEPDAEPDLETTRAAVRQELAAAGVPLPALADLEREPPPPPDPAVVAENLKKAGASDEEIAAVMEALAPPPEEAAAAPPPVALRTEVVGMLERGEPLDELDLSGADLSGLDFSQRSLCGTLLKGANLSGAVFAGAKLEGAVLARADLTDARLPGAVLVEVDLAAVKAARADFTGANLESADFTGADLEGAVFDASHGASTQLVRCRLVGAHFREAKLEDADFTGSELDGAVFERASLPRARLYRVHGKKVSFQSASLPGARLEGAKLAGALCANLAAPGSVWERAVLTEASFHSAVLSGASFARATCLRTLFSAADLVEARFRRAKLAGAAFLQANLMMATFEKADLAGADLRGANLHAAETWKANLADARLDQAIVTQSKLA
ncbi:MAG: DUF2169 domain-containing protein [Polyangiaceae bacterium]|nr:DUF2169 domain-containing protein [Polyangiaceae bacterium]